MDLDFLDDNRTRQRLADARDSLQRAADFRDLLSRLSPRQRELVGLLALGIPFADAPRMMGLSRRAAREHWRRVRAKMQGGM